ncbi:MAG: hypothetical protein Q4B03_09815 [Lachnospiraceae bacterium]|nr:hypothetical protein [Lachnospiraceae bacterium]
MKKTFSDIRQQLSQIDSTKEKIEYIWEYYYLWIIGIIAACCFIVFAVNRFFFSIKENWVYIMFNNTYAEVGTNSDLWEGYVEYTGYDTSEKNVIFNNASYFDYKENVTGNSYFESFVAFTEAGTLDAVTMEADALTALGQSGRLTDLDSEVCASIKEKYGDRFLYCEPYDTEYSTEPVAVGIDISDSILMTEYHIYTDSCALGIGAYSQNIEAVEAFLDYIYTE